MNDTRTDVDAAAELAAEPIVLPVDAGSVEGVALPPGWTWQKNDHERLAATPRRARGVSHVHDAASFVAAVTRRRLPDVTPVVYADEENLALVAVLNDDEADAAGWRDYRVELSLRRTPEWGLWKGADGKLLGQEAFAEHVEDGLGELRHPEPAVMLELAQTFHATSAATFKGGHRLQSGARQFRYEEAVEASAGTAGTIEVPERLTLVVKPFYGSPAYEVTALFRFRLSRDNFTLGYKLDRPHEVERAAFGDVREAVGAGLPDAGIIAGPVPTATS